MVLEIFDEADNPKNIVAIRAGIHSCLETSSLLSLNSMYDSSYCSCGMSMYNAIVWISDRRLRYQDYVQDFGEDRQ